jgi:hypothetical protein
MPPSLDRLEVDSACVMVEYTEACTCGLYGYHCMECSLSGAGYGLNRVWDVQPQIRRERT